MVVRKKRKISAFTIVNTVLLALVTLLMLYPFWYIIIGSVSSTNYIYSGKMLLLPDQMPMLPCSATKGSYSLSSIPFLLL